MTDKIKAALVTFSDLADEAGTGVVQITARDAALVNEALREYDTPAPIDMILHCPECHVQHIDAAEIPLYGHNRIVPGTDWTNPPHRSHLCHNCGTIWRPADVPTNGVAAIKTKGKADRRATPALPQVPEGKALVPVERITTVSRDVEYSPHPTP